MKANKEFYRALEDLEREKNIPKEYMLDKIKAAIASTIKRDKNVPADNVEVIFNEEKENIKVCIKKDIVETVENPQTEISLEEAKQISRRYKLVTWQCLKSIPPQSAESPQRSEKTLSFRR